MLAATAVMMLAACNGSKTTPLAAQFDDNAPKSVRIVSEKIDTTVIVKNGQLKFNVPVDLTTLTYAHAGRSIYSFISDGSKITLNQEDGKAYSDNEKGVHTHYLEFITWRDDFMAAYNKRVNEIGDDKEAFDAYLQEVLAPYNDYLKETLKANRDNALGVMALNQMSIDDPNEMLSLINTLSSEMKERPEVIQMKKACEEELK